MKMIYENCNFFLIALQIYFFSEKKAAQTNNFLQLNFTFHLYSYLYSFLRLRILLWKDSTHGNKSPAITIDNGSPIKIN